MIKKSTLAAFIGILAINFFAASSVFAQGDAVMLFEECQQELDRLAFQCVSANNETEQTCIAAIEHLLDEGHVGPAIHLAHHCVHQIRHRTRHCFYRMSRLCHHCVYRLNQLGAHELAYLLRENCENTVAFVVFAAHNSVESIQELFDDKNP